MIDAERCDARQSQTSFCTIADLTKVLSGETSTESQQSAG